MTEQPAPPASPQRNRGALALVALLLIGGVGFLYVKAGHGGKKEHSAACDASKPLAQSLAALAKGEVAALTIAKEPEPMQPLAFNGPDGAPTSLDAFKGKTVLLNVWATWCVPCRGEMPALDRLQRAAGSDKFEVVAINVDTTRLERPKAFLDEIGVKSLKFYADPKADIFFRLKQGGELMGLPTTYLVDPAGCALGQLSGPADWDSADALALIRRAIGEAP
jgi:thiol-disulfide isomerase/thioredoxin